LSDKTDHPPVPDAFAALGVRGSILRALAEAKFTIPSEIQSLVIPRALAGVDILGQARTGTGKTAAFGIPILQQATRGLSTQALIMVPTRELAVQVEEEIKRLGQFTPIRSVAVYGGQKIAAQERFLRHHPEIIVGTPGRVIDLLDRRIISFENIRFVVLDEVDRMLDIGFRDDIRNILSRVKSVSREFSADDADHGDEADHGHPADQRDEHDDESRERDDAERSNEDRETSHADREPSNRNRDTTSRGAPDTSAGSDVRRHQTIFVSATISEEIEKLARRYMREPVEKLIAPGADDKPTVEKIEQYYCPVQQWDKYRLLRMLLQAEDPDLAIVFCRTKHGAEKLAKRLHHDGIECREIHGNLAQNKRDRVMKSFRSGKFDVLVATDLASRGIDVADISHIINYDLPDDPEVYVHRVGRTARMGAEGKAFSFVGREQGELLTKVENLINMVLPVYKLEGFEPNPPPSDWTDLPPGSVPDKPPKPIVSRFERAYGSFPTPSNGPTTTGEPNAPAPPVKAMPPRTIGSKIPVNKRFKRR